MVFVRRWAWRKELMDSHMGSSSVGGITFGSAALAAEFGQ